MSNFLIPRAIDSFVVNQRFNDGYVNATELCQATGKQFSDYSRLENTEAFIEELSLKTGLYRVPEGPLWWHLDSSSDRY
jgi:hypothetical protein